MSSLLTDLVVEPDTRVSLADIDPASGDFDLQEIGLPNVPPLVESSEPPRLPDFHEKFIVKPGTKINLGEIDPGYHSRYESREAALPEAQFLLWKLDQLQYLLHAEKKHSLLIVVQGLDACGKDGVIRHIL